MKSRLTFGTSMGIPFDTYLVTRSHRSATRPFGRKSRALFHDRMATSSAISGGVSHTTKDLRQFCDAGIVLEEGRLTFFEDLEDAIGLSRGSDGPRRREGVVKGPRAAASRVLRLEADALGQLADALPADFAANVAAIRAASGHVVVSGIGKVGPCWPQDRGDAGQHGARRRISSTPPRRAMAIWA